VGSELIKAGQMDFSALILRFKAADPDFCALGGVQVLTSLMLKEAKKQGFKPRLGFMTHASNVDPELIRLSGEAAEGVMATEITKSPSDSNEPAMVEFRERLKKHYPKLQPGQFALHGYVAAKLFCEAMKRVGQDPTREKLIQSMETIRDFDIGVMAPLSFSPTQHMGLAYCRVTKITKGKFIPFTDWIAYPDKEWVASK
jgi:branched-chain amino acid transport system substrate-binding protein